VIKIEEKQEFLRRMHQQVLAKIALKQGKQQGKQQWKQQGKIASGKAGKLDGLDSLDMVKEEPFSYKKFWEEKQKQREEEKDTLQEKLKMQIWNLKKVPRYAKEELLKFIESGEIKDEVLKEIKAHWKEIEEDWPKEIKEKVREKVGLNLNEKISAGVTPVN
ncbi:hypothetical protein HYU21_04130, partial [Candidatus Woesearchaeota archaeon]|nr:hypothetical protein [Candidatus Woesearchaeota archaeon]